MSTAEKGEEGLDDRAEVGLLPLRLSETWRAGGRRISALPCRIASMRLLGLRRAGLDSGLHDGVLHYQSFQGTAGPIIPDTSVAPSPGTRLGVGEVTAQIGAGGRGDVYRATDSNLTRSVAIKVL